MAYVYVQGGPTAPDSPSLVLPGDYLSVIDATPRFEFDCPSDPDNSRLVFCIEVDTVNTFNSANLKSIESRFCHAYEEDHGYWDYDSDGAGTFLRMPSAGLNSTVYSGRKIRACFPSKKALKTTNYYWRVIVSDNLVYSPDNIVNEFYAGQGEMDV